MPVASGAYILNHWTAGEVPSHLKNNNNFIYFWLCWVFVAARGFSLWQAGLSSGCGAWASHCGGFSCYRARALEHRLSSCGTRASSEKEIATRSSVLAWWIPWTEEPSGLSSTGSPRVGHDWSNLAYMHALEKEMATTPVFLPGGSQGQRSLVGCRLRGCTELGTTEVT